MFKSSKNVVTTTSTEKKAGGLVTSTRTVTTTIKSSGGSKKEVVQESVVIKEDKNFPTSAFKTLTINDKSSESTAPSFKFPTPTSSKQNSTPPQNNKEFAKNCLDCHNVYRKKHGVPPLKLNQSICNYAQEWANKLAATNSFSHRPNATYGENIFYKGSSDPNFDVSGQEVTDNWYSEIKSYKFGGEPRTLNSGHFTQVVWKNCTEFGVGKAKNKGTVIVVANYNPPGNMGGQFKDNVLPPK